MQLCYVDESGKAQTLIQGDAQQQPVVVIAGVSFPEEHVTAITHGWMKLKSKMYPGLAARGRTGWLDAILHEIKGTTIRKAYKPNATGRKRKHAHGMIDGALKLLERYDGRLIARVWIKEVDGANDEMKLHSSAVQFICGAFHAGLPEDERGMVVIDSQTHQHNYRLAHTVFTQRFGLKPSHPKLVDMPVFGHSENHAGLQIADLLASAVLAPIASAVYANAYESWNVHAASSFLDIRNTFGERLELLTYDFVNPYNGKESPSVVVSDPINGRSSAHMWAPTPAPSMKLRRPARPSRKRRGPLTQDRRS